MCRFLSSLVAISVAIFGTSCSKGKWELVSSAKFADAAVILSLEFFDSKHGFAATPFGILETRDGGRTWADRGEAADDFVFQFLQFQDPLNGWAFGAAFEGGAKVSGVLSTRDGGATWVVRESGGSGLITAAELCSSQFSLAAAGDSLLVSTDSGFHWPTKFTLMGPDAALWGVTCTGPSGAVAVGRNGKVVRSSDAGETWDAVEVPTSSHLTRAYFDGELTWTVGLQGTVLVSSDRGSTWQSRSIPSTESLFDIKFLGPRGWIVGSRGVILESTDHGSTWALVPSPVTSDLATIFVLDPNRVWIGGDGFTVLKRNS